MSFVNAFPGVQKNLFQVKPFIKIKKNVALVQGKKGALDNSEWRENLPDITQRLQWKV